MAEWIDVAPVSELSAGDRKVVCTENGPIAVLNLAGDRKNPSSLMKS